MILKQPIKKATRKDSDTESNEDEYLDDVVDLAVSHNKNYYRKRMNSVRNDVISLQS